MNQQKEPVLQQRILKLYSPHSKQLEFHNLNTRFKVASWGRQSGKSTAALNEIIKRAWRTKEGVFWYILPTFKQCRVQFRRALKLLRSSPDVIIHKSETELAFTLQSGSIIQFQSGMVLDNLRTETLNGVVVDEVRDCHPDLWKMVLQPMLATTGGWAIFISTPRGYDQFFDLFEKASKDKNWSRLQSPSTCNPLFTHEEFERLKSEMTEGEFDQEILAQFRDVKAGRAYQNFSQENLVDKNPFISSATYHPNLPIVVGLDFNITPMSWIIGQVHRSIKQWHWEDEIYLKNSHTEEAAYELVERLPMNHPGGIWIVGDATGKARQRAAQGQSDYDILFWILRQRGIKYTDMTPTENPGVKDRVNTVNVYLKNSMGFGRLTLNRTKCPMAIRDLQRVTWKVGSTFTLDEGSDRELTHMSDAMGYPIHAITPIEGVRDVGTIRWIRR